MFTNKTKRKMTPEEKLPKEIAEKLKGLSYATAIKMLDYAKRELEHNLTLS